MRNCGSKAPKYCRLDKWYRNQFKQGVGQVQRQERFTMCNKHLNNQTTGSFLSLQIVLHLFCILRLIFDQNQMCKKLYLFLFFCRPCSIVLASNCWLVNYRTDGTIQIFEMSWPHLDGGNRCTNSIIKQDENI